jgi:tripeptidyl-peptidase-2
MTEVCFTFFLQLEASLQADLFSATGDDTEDLKQRISQIRSLESDLDDPGPIYDCIVFHDGERYQAAVDVTETGDFSQLEPMTDFKHLQQYRRLSDLDALNYGVNIFDEGAVLSNVTDAGAHGTPVAGILGAYHPDQPACNGVAPGCQIVSLKIGDTRLGSMETGVGLMRGLIDAVRCGCNVINMSYGGEYEYLDRTEYVTCPVLTTRWWYCRGNCLGQLWRFHQTG